MLPSTLQAPGPQGDGAFVLSIASPSREANSMVSKLTTLVDGGDVQQIIGSQRNMLGRFEKTNEMLVNCNALAFIRLEAANRDLRRHTTQLQDVKKDIDSIFRRIRVLRTKLAQQYPDAFKSCNVACVLDEEDELVADGSN